MLDCRYARILRTDEDVFLTPRLLTWTPPHDVVFGEVWSRSTLSRVQPPVLRLPVLPAIEHMP